MPENALDNPLKRFDITADQINQVVTVFYAEIRRHPVLGPIFANHIPDTDWPEHEDKIARFWRNAILREKNYNGNPMREHLSRPMSKPSISLCGWPYSIRYCTHNYQSIWRSAGRR